MGTDLIEANSLVVLFTFTVLSLEPLQAGGSLSSQSDDICGYHECSCVERVALCACAPQTPDAADGQPFTSSFQDGFKFRDNSVKLETLKVENCSRIVLLPGAISDQSYLTNVQLVNIGQIELQSQSVSQSLRLRSFSISKCGSLTVEKQAFRSTSGDSRTLSVDIADCGSVTVGPDAFHSIKNVRLSNVADLQLESQAFKVMVSTQEPTVDVTLSNVTASDLPYKVFSSALRNILIESSRVERIRNEAFSGPRTSNITLHKVELNKIERGAFSDQAIIDLLQFDQCNISSISQQSIVAGISTFSLTNSYIQSMAKYGAIQATVASVRVVNNTLKTLGQDSLTFTSWNSVVFVNNTVKFLEEGALQAITDPVAATSGEPPSFVLANNTLDFANRFSLKTQIPENVSLMVVGNLFRHKCDCQIKQYIKSLTDHAGGESSFHDLTGALINTSSCDPSPREVGCFPGHLPQLEEYLELLCARGPLPNCVSVTNPAVTDKEDEVVTTEGNQFIQDFMLLFQVKTTKGILLFLLFCVVCSIIVVTICVGIIYIHRFCQRNRFGKENISGSFQFNSGEEKQILYGSDQTTCHSLPEEEPQYAEIGEGTNNQTEITTLTEVSDYNTSLSMPKSTTTTLPSLANSDATYPRRFDELGTGKPAGRSVDSSLPLLPPVSSTMRLGDSSAGRTDSRAPLLTASAAASPVRRIQDADKSEHRKSGIRVSMSETSLTDEIMMALREKLNDPSLYSTVLDATNGTVLHKKTDPLSSAAGSHHEDLYCSPIYAEAVDPKRPGSGGEGPCNL